MKKYIALFLFLLIGVAGFSAQKKGCANPKMWKEIQEFKLKFLAQEIELQKDQQAKFFELYNEMADKRKAIFEEIRSTQLAIDSKPDATDQEYEAASKKIESLREKDMSLHKEYDKKFEQILTNRQMYKLRTAEDKFRMKMQQMKYKGKHKGNLKDERVKPAKPSPKK